MLDIILAVWCIFSTRIVHIILVLLQSEESRIAKEVEAHEIRIRKELEKQENLRRKVVSLEIFLFF